MSNIEQKRETYKKWFSVGLVGLGALLVAPIIFMVVQGLVGLIIAGTIGLVAVNVAPYLAMKLANWKVKMIVSEATENPIETLTNVLIEKKKAYEDFKQRVTESVSARNQFEQQCKNFSIQYPERAKEFTTQLEHMNKHVEKQKIALGEAKVAIAAGQDKLQEMKAYFDMATALQRANKATNMDTGDIYEKLKVDTAVDAVYNSMSVAFAQMEILSSEGGTPKLENSPSPVLTTVIDAKVKVVS